MLRLVILIAIEWCLALSTLVYAQTSTLQGTVTDAVRGSAVPAASVIVSGTAGNVIGRTLTGVDGHYSIANLSLGGHVKVAYQRGGYSPNPGIHDVRLNQTTTVQDVQLILDTSDDIYWRDWSAKVKSKVESSSATADDRTKMYEHSWSKLGTLGLSPEAQAKAAKELTTLAPESRRSQQISAFAAVNTSQLRQNELEVQNALQGQSKLSPAASVPPDVAAEVAATELRKATNEGTNKDEFLKNYRAVWGEAGLKEVQEKGLEKSKARTMQNIVGPGY